MIHEITDDNFETEIKKSNLPVLIDFWAPWCGPCKMLNPIMEEINKIMKDKIKICKMNIDESPKIPSELGIRGIPTMIIFKSGKMIDTKVGMHSQSVIEEWLNSKL